MENNSVLNSNLENENFNSNKDTINKIKKQKASTIRAQNYLFLKEVSTLSNKKVLEKLDSSFLGLNEEEVKEKQKEIGYNTVNTKNFVWYYKFLRCLINPFIIVLFGMILFHVIFYATGNGDKSDLISTGILSTMIILSVNITYLQDYRSYKSATKLKAMVTTTTSALRNIERFNLTNDLNQLLKLNKKTTEVNTHDLVPGDIIFLRAGDLIPADIKILHAVDLFVNQATLTGESELIEKFAVNKGNNKDILTISNLAFMGTSINAGSCVAVVVSTGKNTYLGSIARAINSKMPRSSFDKGIKKVTYLIIGFILVMTPIVFAINYFIKSDLTAAILYAVSVAVGLTPEMLPMIVSANLARGAVKMSKEKVIVKNLTAIQSFGEMTVLCTDKTGTLTSEKIELVRHLDMNGVENMQVLEWAYLNSFYQTGLKNNIDQTVIEHIKAHHDKIVHTNYYKVDEIPFDFSRRRLSVVVNDNEQDSNLLITKGAVEEILSVCTKVEVDGAIIGLDEKMKRQVVNLSKKLNQEGLRVIAVCHKKFTSEKEKFTVNDEKEMVLAGYIGFLDVPKPSAIKAVKSLYNHGVSVKILTGDNEIVTKAICKKIGISVGEVLLGSDIELMSDEQLKKVANQTMIFAKMDPLAKARVIRVLKEVGETVGFLGDGVNDAVALKTADVGICVDSGVEIAKDVADIILLEKDLNVLEQGVILGRHTFANIIKYIKITMASNFGNVFSVLIASAMIPFTPMAPLMLLFQNLLYDISQLAIPWDRVDKEYLQKPKKWDAKSFLIFSFWNGPLSSVFDVTTFLFMGYALHTLTNFNPANGDNDYYAKLFQSGWFVLGLISQTMIVHLCRTSKVPFIQSRATWQVGVMTMVIISIGLIIPFTGFGTLLGLVPLPGIYFPYLLAALLSYFILNQGLKALFIKVHHQWL